MRKKIRCGECGAVAGIRENGTIANHDRNRLHMGCGWTERCVRSGDMATVGEVLAWVAVASEEAASRRDKAQSDATSAHTACEERIAAFTREAQQHLAEELARLEAARRAAEAELRALEKIRNAEKG